MLSPFLSDLPPAIALHLVAALLALGLGPVAIYRRRRDRLHKVAGYAWVSSMAVLAGGSFWIEAGILPLLAGFGPIHLLSVFVLVVLARGVAAARRGDIRRHRAEMHSLYWTGLWVAGLFTLLPGRILNRLVFADVPEAGYVAILTLGAGVVWVILRDWRGWGRKTA